MVGGSREAYEEKDPNLCLASTLFPFMPCSAPFLPSPPTVFLPHSHPLSIAFAFQLILLCLRM